MIINIGQSQMINLVRYNTGEMNFLCPGVKAEDCVVDDRGRNSCDGPCNLSLYNDLQSSVFQMFLNRIVD